jgi:hypothetical protein
MSSWGVAAPDEEPRVRRVREEVKDGVAASLCSLGASALVCIALTVIVKLVG